jgi:uncharacterized protein with FMN-binding domain
VRRAILAAAATAATASALIVVKSHGGTVAKAVVATPSPSAPKASGKLPPGTYTITGPSIATKHGAIQVRISVVAGRLTDVVAVQVSAGGRSTEINRWAVPILREEALVAQSAHIDTVSGATNTSEAYRQSLQAAIDAAAEAHRN